jgi:hypothetical protein
MRSTRDRILERTQVRAGLLWAKETSKTRKPEEQLELVRKMAKRYEGIIGTKTVEELFYETGGEDLGP